MLFLTLAYLIRLHSILSFFRRNSFHGLTLNSYDPHSEKKLTQIRLDGNLRPTASDSGETHLCFINHSPERNYRGQQRLAWLVQSQGHSYSGHLDCLLLRFRFAHFVGRRRTGDTIATPLMITSAVAALIELIFTG